jgi:hypothetical protein
MTGLLFFNNSKGLNMKTFWEFIAFLLLGITLGYMFVVALTGV